MKGPGPFARIACPGCRLEQPPGGLSYDRKFNASAECWALFEQLLAKEFQSAVLFARAHQLSVDAYAVQHAGGAQPDKSVDIHLAGLCLVFEDGLAPVSVPPMLQRIAGAVDTWPHLAPPSHRTGALTVRSVVLAPDPDAHVLMVRAWASEVWETWRPHHAAVRALVARAS